MAVEPPTDPAVCTRIIGLPAAPSASARYSSGIMTPSNVSGALPMTTASMSFHVMSASSSARCAASRTQAGHRHVLAARLVLGLADPDDRGRLSAHAVIAPDGPLQDADEVLLQAADPAWRGQATRRRPFSATCSAASAMRTSPVAMIGLAAQRPAGRVDLGAVIQPERRREDQLLVGELRVQLGHLDRPVREPGVLGRLRGGRSRSSRSRTPGIVRFDAVVDAADPRGREPAGGRSCRACSLGGEHHGDGPVGDRWESWPRSGSRTYALRKQRVSAGDPRHLGVGVARGAVRLRAATSAKSRSVASPRVEHGAGLQRGQRDRIRPRVAR